MGRIYDKIMKILIYVTIIHTNCGLYTKHIYVSMFADLYPDCKFIIECFQNKQRTIQKHNISDNKRIERIGRKIDA